jgi:hypothetical protein
MRKSFTLINVLKSLIICTLLIGISNDVIAQVSGTVFKDFNANGTFDSGASYNEVGQSGVEVKAYDSSGASLAVTYTGGGTKTNGTGEYSVASATPGQVRLEFILPDNYIFATIGATGGTSVMFPTTSTQNLAVNTPDDYWDNTTIADPTLLIPIYTQGALTSAYKDKAGLYSLKQSASSPAETFTNGSNQTFPAIDTLMDKIEVCKMKDIGTVWGVAFDKKNQTYYLSAFAKRHSGEGPLGFGGIYIIQKNSNGTYTKKTGIDLQGLTPSLGSTLDLGTITRTNTDNTSDNYIADPIYTPSWDLDAYAKVGVMSYGDADFFEAGQKLFVTNLKQKTLLEIDASSDLSGLSGAALGAKIKSYDITTLPNVPTCTGGVLRIWGLKIYKGVGYLGAVCDASISQDKNDLKGYILSFDPNNVAAGFTTVLNINLNYRDYSSEWHPWTSNWSQTGVGIPNGGFVYTEPAISDMEFDERGNLIISVMSITGHKLGYGNYLPVSGNTTLIVPISGGDLLRACYNDVTKSWVMEGTNGCNQNFTATENAEQGYIATGANGLGEFFDDPSGDGNSETVMGSLAKVMGTNNVVSTVIDPFPNTVASGEGFWSTGGLQFYNVQTGTWNQQARLYEGGWQENYGKVYGLGDLEFALTSAPIEIGNRVFMDTDSDGEQDAGEMGLDGIKVELWKAGSKVKDVTTTNGGQWYFTNLDAKTDYEIKILAASFPSGKSLTILNTASNAKDLIDSDASLVGSDAVITYKTGSAGQNNHALDFGFKTACIKPTVGPDQTLLCAANSTPTTATVAAATVGTTWTVLSQPNGVTAAITSAGAITGMTATGKYIFLLTDDADNSCKDSLVIRIKNCTEQTLCGTDKYYMEGDVGLTDYQWYKKDLTGASFSTLAGETNQGITVTGTGYYYWTAKDGNGCVVTACDTVKFVCICTPPNAGVDQVLSCVNNVAPTTVTLTAAPSGYTWFVLTQPSGASASINNTGAASALSKSGDYIFELRKDSDPTCKDSVTINVPICTIPCPSPNCGGGIGVRKL